MREIGKRSLLPGGETRMFAPSMRLRIAIAGKGTADHVIFFVHDLGDASGVERGDEAGKFWYRSPAHADQASQGCETAAATCIPDGNARVGVGRQKADGYRIGGRCRPDRINAEEKPRYEAKQPEQPSPQGALENVRHGKRAA